LGVKGKIVEGKGVVKRKDSVGGVGPIIIDETTYEKGGIRESKKVR